jgi:hypothetical protein
LLHNLKHLGLHQQDLLQSRWGWQISNIVVLVVGAGMLIPCVNHLID